MGVLIINQATKPKNKQLQADFSFLAKAFWTIKKIKIPTIRHVAPSRPYEQFLDSDRCEWREVDDSVPKDADYSVWVSGDSMEPRFINRQWIYVREQETIQPGEIGVFLCDGESYCKVFIYVDDQPVLVSLNPKHEPIVVSMAEDFRVMGKVVG